jgi:hypothetical protein
LLNNRDIPLSQGERQFLKTEVLTERRQKKNLTKKLSITPDEMFSQIQSRSYLLFRPKSKIVYFPYSDDSEVIQLTWIFPHAKEILEAAQYYEIDSSFEMFKPFLFSVPLAIIDNESFPLGLQISPTESFRHYATFFRNLDKTFNLHNFFHGKIFLSDMGKAIGKLVKKIGQRNSFVIDI